MAWRGPGRYRAPLQQSGPRKVNSANAKIKYTNNNNGMKRIQVDSTELIMLFCRALLPSTQPTNVVPTAAPRRTNHTNNNSRAILLPYIFVVVIIVIITIRAKLKQNCPYVKKYS